MGLFKDWHNIMQLFIIKLVCCLGWLSAIAFGQMELSNTVTGAVSFPTLGITCLGNAALFYSSCLRGGLYLEMGAKDALTFLSARIKLKSIQGSEDKLLSDCSVIKLSQTTCENKDLSDCSVIMLSQKSPNRSTRQFIEYIANVYNVRSILLQYLPLSSLPLIVEVCSCPWSCECIVFWAGVDEAITMMLAKQMPGTMKRLSESLCLLPSLDCLKNGCHGRNRGLYVEESDVEESDDHWYEFRKTKRLREDDSCVLPLPAVCGLAYSSILEEKASCICIPVLQENADTDIWTELLIGSFKSKDYATRGAIIRAEIRSVSGDLENYLARSGQCFAAEEYSIPKLMVPRFTEIVINLLLTFWLKVDGFSSALAARRAVRNYIVDDTSRGFAAHVFISKAEVRSNDDYTDVYQVLSFRNNMFNPIAVSVIVGCVNLICSIIWAVLAALEGGTNKWYHTHSMPPSTSRVAVLFGAIAIALGMDCVDLCLYLLNPSLKSTRLEIAILEDARLTHERLKDAGSEDAGLEDARLTHERLKDAGSEDAGLEDAGLQDAGLEDARLTHERLKDAGSEDAGLEDAGLTQQWLNYKKKIVIQWLNYKKKIVIVFIMIVFQLLCLVSVIILARTLGIKAFGRWIYGAVQGLAWVKWGIGSYLIGPKIPREKTVPSRMTESTGMYMYSSAFLLNAFLAGARAKWEFS